jgi:hypothetical protein
MKFWSTGRLDIAITSESFQPIMLEVEEKINCLIKAQDYGDLIQSFDVIINIFQEASAEKFWYSPKSKETNIDVNIDHDQFLNSDKSGRFNLYINAILKSVTNLKRNKNLKSFNFTLLYDTIESLIIK